MISDTQADNDNNQADDQSAAGSMNVPEGFVPPTNTPTEPSQSPLEVSVDQNIERAMRVMKRKLIREGLFKELKLRRYYEKPCERKKRKKKESVKRLRKEAHRQKRYDESVI